MRSYIFAATLALAAFGAGSAAAAAASAPEAVTTFTVACRKDAAITAAERAAVEAVGMAAFDRVAARAHADAYEMLAPELQRQMSQAGFAELLGKLDGAIASMDPDGKLANGRVTSVYLLDVTGTPPDRFASCEGPDGRTEAQVAIVAAPRQAHVTIEADGAGMRWAFTLWLREQNGRWDVYGFHFTNTTMAGRDAAAMWAAARTARANDEQLMAAILYRIARTLTLRGNYFTLPIKGEIEADIRTLDATLIDSDLVTTYWEDGALVYGASDVLVAQNGDGTFRVVLMREEWVWRGKASVEAENRAMIRSFLKIFPEIPREFQGVEVRANHPDGTTVHATEYRIDKRRFVAG